MSKNRIVVSVVVPIRNEEAYIDAFLASVLAQDYRRENLEILLIDGMSEDKTVEKIKAVMAENDHIKLLENPQKTIQFALNIGIEASEGRYVVRLDAHSEFAPDYISKCINYLEKTGCANVGGPMLAKGKTDVQQVIAASYSSTFALGGGKNHDAQHEGHTDTVFLGAFRRDTLLEVGMYDENLTINEDDDLNFRLTQAGHKIYMTPEIRSTYYPRSSYVELFRQFYRYGLWKVAVIKKHQKPARISHLVPAAFVLSLVLALIWRGLFVVLVPYLFLNFYFSFKNDCVSTLADKLRLMWVHFVLHLSYGLGFWVGIFKFWGKKF